MGPACCSSPSRLKHSTEPYKQFTRVAANENIGSGRKHGLEATAMSQMQALTPKRSGLCRRSPFIHQWLP
jgi:hypothetical protein